MNSASGDAISRIYNTSWREGPSTCPRISSEIVWNAFYLHALLLRHTKSGALLTVPHLGLQADRFTSALVQRNMAMAGTGQPHWAHGCDGCEKVAQDPETGPCKYHISCTIYLVTNIALCSM